MYLLLIIYVPSLYIILIRPMLNKTEITSNILITNVCMVESWKLKKDAKIDILGRGVFVLGSIFVTKGRSSNFYIRF